MRLSELPVQVTVTREPYVVGPAQMRHFIQTLVHAPEMHFTIT
jgi:hypothetical protein